MRTKMTVMALCACAALVTSAQDTTRVTGQQSSEKKKLITQELGFNFLAMASQLNFIEPIQGQLPYYAMYNIYYKDFIGLRLGAGMFSSNDQTEIEGSTTPSITASESYDFRSGISVNIARERRVTLNTFADFLLVRAKFETITTGTMQITPDPILTRTSRFTNSQNGYGFQAGFGVKLDIYKNLSLYTEMPFGWKYVRHDNDDLVKDDGGGYDQTITHTYSSFYYLTLPVSIYLLVRF